MSSWLTYLLEVSVCHILFYLIYIGLFRNLSFFQTNRIYLLIATILGFVIPTIQIPFWESNTAEIIVSKINNSQVLSLENSQTNIPDPEFPWLISLAFTFYLGGMIFHFSRLIGTIIKVSSLIKKHGVRQFSEVKTVYLNSGPAIFVFLNYVFINMNKMNVTSDEFQQVIEHEKNHINQRHSLDNIMIELTIIVCWFNPILRLIKKELNNTHEFYADQIVTKDAKDIDSYSRLILRLSSNQKEHISLTNQFSMYNIKRRIIMLNKKENKKSYLLRYAVVIPCLIFLLVSFSFVEKRTQERKHNLIEESSLLINNITWKGNSRYSSEFLSNYMEISKGVEFNEEAINKKLNYNPEGSDLASLFMDQGYLFFTVEMKKTVNSQTVDLMFDLHEGDVITINKISVIGNKKVDSKKILSTISLKSGDLFNRSKLIEAQRKIAESGLVDAENVVPDLIPNPSEGTVDIEFKVR